MKSQYEVEGEQIVRVNGHKKSLVEVEDTIKLTMFTYHDMEPSDWTDRNAHWYVLANRDVYVPLVCDGHDILYRMPKRPNGGTPKELSLIWLEGSWHVLASTGGADLPLVQYIVSLPPRSVPIAKAR